MGRIDLALVALAAVALVAGPAAAQGTFNSGSKPRGWTPVTPAAKPKPHETPYAPLPKPAPATTPKAPGLAQPPPFKPYEPWKPTSVFGADEKARK